MSENPRKKNNSLKKADGTEEANQAVLPEEITEVLEGVPTDKRKALEAIMISQTSMISRVSPEMETSKKITSEHITKMLDTDAKAMEHSFKDKAQLRIFYGVMAVLVAIVLLLLVQLLKDNPEAMEKILTIVLTALVSGSGGYGLGKSRKNDN